MRVAVLDLGTNTFHLLIADLFEKHYKLVYKAKEDVLIPLKNLENDSISKDTADRIIQVLQKYRGIIAAKNTQKTVAIATSAIRTATNGKDIIKRIEKEVNIHANIISGEEEAHLIYQGVKGMIDKKIREYLVVDIGGGSVELIAVYGDEVIKKSLEIGAQRLLHAFHKEDPMPVTDRERLFAYLDEKIRPFLHSLPTKKISCLVGTSGTFNTLRNIHHLRNHTRQAIITPIQADDFQKTIQHVVSRSRSERLKIAGIPSERVDMIVVGSLTVQRLMESLQVRAVIVSPFSLREGIIQQEIEKNK